MAKLAIPSSPRLYTTKYDNLRGLDVANPPTEISTYHAADMLNIIPDRDNGVPSKRIGWRVEQTFTDDVLATYHDPEHDFDIIATKRQIIKHDISADTYTAILNQVTDADHVTITPFMGNVYIIGWGDYYELTPPGYSTVSPVDEYVPNTVISRKQDGTGGVALEGVNAFFVDQIISFLSTAEPGDTPTDKDYYLYPKTDRGNHFPVISKVEVFDAATMAWKEDTGATSISETIAGVATVVGVTLSAAHAQVVLGQDDVRVTFSDTLQSSADRDAIRSADLVTTYGLNTMDRIFFAKGNKIYYTEPENAGYVPDDNYLIIGHDTPIVGLHRYNGYLVAITEDSDEFTIYMVHGLQQSIVRTKYNTDGSVDTESELMTYFSVKATIAGTGAVAPKSFATLVDDPLFLGKEGIYGINTTSVNSVTVVTNRSYNVNPWLIQETDLASASACTWQGFYLLSVNGHVYILDSRHTVRTPTGVGYECYFWDNVHADVWLAYDDNLFFANGNVLCRFNTDRTQDAAAWTDDSQWNIAHTHLEEGDPIFCHYTLRKDYDGAPQYYKVLTKKGTVVELYPYDKSGATVYATKDDGTPIVLKDAVNTSEWSWSFIDFNNFSFVSNRGSRFIYTKKKIKKYKTLQIKIENNNASERMAVISVTKTYTVGNFAKG